MEKKTFIYPKNLTANAMLWFWRIRDFIILLVCGLAAIFVAVNTRSLNLLACFAAFGVLTMRLEDMSLLDYILISFKYFCSEQQCFEWKKEDIKYDEK